MKHILFGGNGFVGRHITHKLLDASESVLICDLPTSRAIQHAAVRTMHVDITDPQQLAEVPIMADDIVYNVATRVLHPIVPRRLRRQYFRPVVYTGAVNIIEAMERASCPRLIQFSTDMVYGRLQAAPPIGLDHPRNPLGEYSSSKKELEDYCLEKRRHGLKISIFRPRIINGPGRGGILGNLFLLIHRSLPVPMIGNGSNRYQMISVFDCANAVLCSVRAGVIDGEFNLGSIDPPTVRVLLGDLIRDVGSRSMLIPTPGRLTKGVLRMLDSINLPLLVPEQYQVADNDYVLDITQSMQRLNWSPRHTDQEMMLDAYHEFAAAAGWEGARAASPGELR